MRVPRVAARAASRAARLRRVRSSMREDLALARAVEAGQVTWADGEEPTGGGPAESSTREPRDESAEPSGQRSSLPALTLALLTIGAGWFALSLLHELSSVIAPLFFGLNLLITTYPIHRWMVRHRFPSWLGALTSGLTVVVVLAAGVAGMVWSVAATVDQLQTYTPRMVAMYKQAIELLTRFGWSEDVIASKLKAIDPQQVLSVATSLVSDTSSVVTMIVVILTAMVFMIMDTPSMHERLRIAGRSKPDIVLALEGFASGIRRYWLVTTLFGIIVALFDWAALLVIGVPLAGVWALFSFLTNYIPNIGFVIGLLPPALLALFQDGWWSALAVVVSYSVLNFVIQSIIQPKFAGDAVGLTPTMSFLSLLLWGWCFGALGTLIALPCSLLVKSLLIDRDPGARWVNAIISSRPEEGDDGADDAEKDDRVEHPGDDDVAGSGEQPSAQERSDQVDAPGQLGADALPEHGDVDARPHEADEPAGEGSAS